MNFKGNDYTNPHRQLSGGELSRINLALTLAMSNISGSQILLLDEVLSSIGDKHKEDCLDLIKSQTIGRCCVNILHDAIEGVHDSKISA